MKTVSTLVSAIILFVCPTALTFYDNARQHNQSEKGAMTTEHYATMTVSTNFDALTAVADNDSTQSLYSEVLVDLPSTALHSLK